MDSNDTLTAIAGEAWSQLVLSIISNSPPSDMSRSYYYTYPERGFDYLQKQLKRLQRYKYKLGTKNIQTRMRYNMLFVQANDDENQQGIDYIRDCARTIKHSNNLQENEDENQQGIEHIQYCLISSKHSELVQTNEDGNNQDIEHIQECLRSSKHSEVLQANEDEYQQGIEHIQYCLISSKHRKMVQTNEDENQQGMENIRDCLRSSKHYEVVPVNEDESHQWIDHILDSPSIPVLGNEQENHPGMSHIVDCPRSCRHSDVVLEDEDKKNLQGNEHCQECRRSIKAPKVVQANEDENQQGIEHIQDTLRLSIHSELAEQTNEHENHIEHIQESIKSTVSFKPAELTDRELIYKFRQNAGLTESPEAWQEPEDVYQQLINYKEARKLSTLFDELLEVIENKDLLQEEKPTLRFQVLKVIKLLHHYGIDIIRRGVEIELENVNLNSDNIEEDMAMYHKKKSLEVMLRICNTATCQTTIHDIIGKAERHQVFFI